jgi:hypothetical protein
MALKTVQVNFLEADYDKQMTKLFKKHGITKENLVNITPLGSTIYITYDGGEDD